jgi:hypothetical protein
MMLKEAWEEIKKLLDINVKEEDIPPEDFDHYDFALDIVDDFIEKTEQAPTLEKLGYEQDFDNGIVRLYKNEKEATEITFEYTENKVVKVYKSKAYWGQEMTPPELLACAEVIKEMEKEKV